MTDNSTIILTGVIKQKDERHMKKLDSIHFYYRLLKPNLIKEILLLKRIIFGIKQIEKKHKADR
jgi:hypothetical protein